MTDEFDDLFVNEDELNKDLLKGVLEGRVKLAKQGSVIFEVEQGAKQAIVLYLLANKVFALKGVKETEAEGPKNIHLNTGVKEGTVKPIVRELEEQGILKGDKGKYYVPNYALKKVEALFKKDVKED